MQSSSTGPGTQAELKNANTLLLLLLPLLLWLVLHVGFPGGPVVKNPPPMQETQDTQILSLVWNISWSRKWQPTPVFLPGKSNGQRSLADYSLWDHRESDTTERLRTRTAQCGVHYHTLSCIPRGCSGAESHSATKSSAMTTVKNYVWSLIMPFS